VAGFTSLTFIVHLRFALASGLLWLDLAEDPLTRANRGRAIQKKVWHIQRNPVDKAFNRIHFYRNKPCVRQSSKQNLDLARLASAGNLIFRTNLLNTEMYGGESDLGQ